MEFLCIKVVQSSLCRRLPQTRVQSLGRFVEPVPTVATDPCVESRQVCGVCGNPVSAPSKICAPAPSAFPVFFPFEEEELVPKEQELHGRGFRLSRERKSQRKGTGYL